MSKSKSKLPTTTYYTYSMDPTYVYRSGGFDLFGSSKSKLDLMNWDTTDLIINCTGIEYVNKPFIDKAPAWLNLNMLSAPIPHQLVLNWPDLSAPNKEIDLAFWQNILEQARGNGIKTIVCCCGAGLGRTGTALASLLLAEGTITEPDEAIEFVRTHYTTSAIENAAQEYYIWNLIYANPVTAGFKATKTYSSTVTSAKPLQTLVKDDDTDDTEFVQWITENSK